MTAGAALRRATFLVLGGAVALGVVAVTAGVVSVLVRDDGQVAGLVLLALVPMSVVGLVPGVRELEVAGAATLLGADRTVVPEPTRWAHRWRTCLWTFLHQVVGFATCLLLAVAVGAAGAAAVLAAGGRPPLLEDLVARPTTPAAWSVLCAVAVGTLVVALGSVRLAGAAAARVAPVLLGPVGADLLAAAEERLRTEQEYRRISRDLHDGVGHALSAISLQAGAARLHVGRSPERATAALTAIGDLAGAAVAELDHVLGVLRDEAVPRAPEPGLTQLDGLVRTHLRLGADVVVSREGVGDLPPLVSRTAYRVCAEGLANAAAHGTGPVTVVVSRDGGLVEVTVRNPGRRRPGGRAGSGHGLEGLRERLDVLGGELTAGPDGGGWLLRARLPTGSRRA